LCWQEVPVTAGPWDSRARAHVHLRAADADREQVVEILTTAFVQGRLDLDELTLRAGQALASRTYAELADTFADLPAPPLRAPAPPKPARPPAPMRPPPPPAGRMPASAKAVVWTACVIVAVPAVWAAYLTYYGRFLVLFLLAFTGLTVMIGTTADRRAAG
jgi:Domain of unknown function (DUF1707)